MKNFLFLFCLICVSEAYAQKNTSVVNRIQGLYVFTDCQPIDDYEVLGEITTEGHNDKDIKKSGGQYQTIRDALIKKVKQTFYSADGIILSLVNGGTDKATVIKFKEKSDKNAHAKVNQYQGLYIFVDSKPVNEFEYQGTVKVSLSLSSQYTAIRDKLIKKCKSDFESAKGIVIKLVTGGKDLGDAITFAN